MSKGKGYKVPSLKYMFMAAVVVTIAVMATLVVWNRVIVPMTGLEQTPTPTPSGEVRPPQPGDKWFYQTGGLIDIAFYYYWAYDNSLVTTSSSLPKVVVYHADKTNIVAVNSTWGSDGTVTLSGNLWIRDSGILYVAVDQQFVTTKVYYHDASLTKGGSDQFTGTWEAWDYDKDGSLEYAYKMDLTLLPTLQAGESKKTLYSNLYGWKYDSSLTWTSQTNATSISTSSYNYYTAEGYLGGWDGEGYAIKIVKAVIEIGIGVTSTDTTNKTYVDSGYLKIAEVKLWNFDWTSGFTWDYGSSRYTINIDVPDEAQEVYGKMIKYERAAGSSFAKYLIKAYAQFPSASKTIYVTLKLTIIQPDNTITTTKINTSFAS